MSYRWDINVRKLNVYGDKVVERYPASIVAANRGEVTSKVRDAFESTYDDFRKFWSHDWVLNSMTEEPAPAVSHPEPTEEAE